MTTPPSLTAEKSLPLWSLPVIVGALGYFVDVYDIVIFGVVRVASLSSIGVAPEDMTSAYVYIYNWQMVGMLLGGLLWGMLADKIGRIRALFGSILIYSLASIASAYPYSVDTYALIRFIAGIGLAGEIGGAITLVSEIFPKHRRGLAAGIIGGFGFLGGIAAALMTKFVEWQTAYIIGGVLGLLLLALRVKMNESPLFKEAVDNKEVKKADLRLFLWPRRRLLTYIACVLVSVPVYFVLSILVNLAPELSKALSAAATITVSNALFWCFSGLVLGNVVAGFLSNHLESRKKPILLLLLIMAALVVAFLFSPQGMAEWYFYMMYGLLGFTLGYSVLFFLMGAEQYGTNVRGTVTTTLPNLMRGAAIPINLGFLALKPDLGFTHAALAIGSVTLILAVASLCYLKETYGRDLDFVEKS